MNPLRFALALLLSLALLANGWAVTRLHAGGLGEASSAEVAALSSAASVDAMPPCHGATAKADAAEPADMAAESSGCCSGLCQHLCGLMLTLLPPVTAGALGVVPATSAGLVPASERFVSQPATGLWRPPRA